jgi:hypothetical protein
MNRRGQKQGTRLARELWRSQGSGGDPDQLRDGKRRLMPSAWGSRNTGLKAEYSGSQAEIVVRHRDRAGGFGGTSEA